MVFCQHQVWIGVFLLITSYMVDCASIEHHFRPIRETNELDKIISTVNQKYDSNNETSALPKTSENTTPSEIAKRTTKLNKLDTSSEFNDKQKENIYLRPVIKHQNNDYSDSSKYELFKTTSKPYVSPVEEEKKNYLKYEVTSQSINPDFEEEVKSNVKNKIPGRGSVKYGRGNEDAGTTIKVPIVNQNSPKVYEDKSVKLTETFIYEKKNDSPTESNQNAKSYSIDKYVSQQTHTSNNVFTKPSLVNVEYSNNYGGMGGYADSIPYNSYTDDIQPFKHYSSFNNFDLTTPKTKFFDDGHSRISNSIKQNLEAVDFDTNAHDQTKKNSDSSFVTKFDDSHVDYKNFEKLQLNINQQESKKHSDIDAQNRTLVNIKSEFVETKSYTDIPKNQPIDHFTSESQNIDLTTKLMEKSTESSVNKDKYTKAVLKSKDFGVSERKLTTVKPKTHSLTDEEEFESVKIDTGITTDMPNFADEKLNVYTKSKSSYLSTSVPTSIDPLMEDTKLNLEKEHFVNSNENNINLKKRGSTKFINDIVPTNIPKLIVNSTMANSKNTTYIEKVNTYPEKIVLAFNENDNNNKINTIKNQTISAGSENHIQSILLNRVSDQDLEKTDKENSVKYIIDKDLNSEKNTSTPVTPNFKEKLNTLRIPSKEKDNLEADASTKMNDENETTTTTSEFETTTYFSTKMVQDTTVDTTTEKTYEPTTLTQNLDTENPSSVQGTVDTTEHSTEFNEFTTTVTYQTESDMQTTKAQSTVAISTTEQPTTTDAITLTDLNSTELKTEPSVLNITVASTNAPTISIVPDHNLIAPEEHEFDNGHSEENSDTEGILKNTSDDKEKSNSIKQDEKDPLDEIKNDEKETLDEVRTDDKDVVDEKEHSEVVKNNEKDSPEGMKNEEKEPVEAVKNTDIEPIGVKIGDKESLDVTNDDSIKNNDKEPSESIDLKTLDEGGVIDESLDNNENKTMVNNNKETKINDGNQNQKGFDTIPDDHKVSEQGEGIDDEEEHNFGELDINNGTKNTDSNKYVHGSLDKDYDDGVGHDISVQPTTTSSTTSSSKSAITVDAENKTSISNKTETLGYRESSSNFTSTEDPDFNADDGYTTAKIVAIVVSSIAGVCLILLAGLLIILRKRQKRFNYGQRCTPVSLDAYSLDSVSVYNSMRRKGVLHASKRSYGNPAFEDPVSLSHPMSFAALANFMLETEEITNEFDKINQITVQSSEVPPGCEHKNRYANVIPLPETRVFLKIMENEPSSDYINANFVRGFKSKKQCYIACQAPMENTLNDFWRMIWEQNSTVILMLTDLFENGVEKCADYLPPSEGLDCHREFGDFQVTLKKREVKEKYIISSLQLKNMVSNSWHDVTHLWYLGWPDRGVPEEVNSIIAFLIEARSYLKTSNKNVDKNHDKETTESSNNYISCDGDNGPGPVTVHCSPGTGRTGVVICSDIAIREFEQTRMIDVPKTVYQVRRDRAGAVQTKDQYQFIYKIINLYAAKLTGGVPDSI